MAPTDERTPVSSAHTGRFAPSPTGALHLGNLRTALLAWLFARSAGAAFLVRMEDLDQAVARPEHERQQLADLAAIGLDWDGPVVRQSERRVVYAQAIDDLTARGLTYPCYCSRREIREAASAPHGRQADGAYPGTCRDLAASARRRMEDAGRPAALRLRSDGEVVHFVDRLAGPFVGLVDDLVLRRGDGTPAYNLAVVVDDAAQGVGEVVRGDDLLASTPRQIHLARLLGIVPPSYAHVPLALGPDGSRLAKRHGAVSLADLADAGLGPAAVLGRLAASAGLVEPGAPVDLATLVADFDPSRIPRDPWRPFG